MHLTATPRTGTGWYASHAVGWYGMLRKRFSCDVSDGNQGAVTVTVTALDVPGR
jgi:hypothetical protein